MNYTFYYRSTLSIKGQQNKVKELTVFLSVFLLYIRQIIYSIDELILLFVPSFTIKGWKVVPSSSI